MKRYVLCLLGLASVVCCLIVVPGAFGQSGGASYRFDEGSGSSAIDSSGAGNTGTISGASYVSGYSGTALRFRANGLDNVSLPRSVFNGFGNTAFFEAWIKPSSYPSAMCGTSAWGEVFRKRGDYNDWSLNLYNDGTLSADLSDRSGGGINTRSSAAVPLNAWSKVAMWYDGLSMRIYLNDAEIARKDQAMSLDWFRNYIGAQIGNNTFDSNCSYAFAGDIDEVVIATTKPPAGPDATSTLKLVSGTIAGQSVSPSNRTITVSPGASISGSFSVQINSTWASNAVMAMGVTPTWGSHATSLTDLGGFSTPVSGLSRTIQVNYTAPSTAGTYYIIAAFQAEYTAAQVMSCTSWAVAAPVWNNGDDVADWSASTIDTANANGNVLVNYLATSGNLPRYVPATAIKVVVAASGGGGGASYRFDEGSGSSAIDSSGAGNTGTISGATYVSGYSGTALRFRANGLDNVSVPRSVFNGFGNTAFFEAWIKPSSYPGVCGTSTARGTVFRKRGDYNDWSLNLLNNGTLTADLSDQSGGGIGFVSSAVVPLNTWSKVAMWYDGLSMRIYLNDAEIARKDQAMGLDWFRNYIGAQIGNNTFDSNCSYAFAGDIDEVVIATTKPPAGGGQGPDATSTLKLVSGTIAGQPVSPSNRTITVSAGASVSGSFSVQINSTWASNAVMAMGVTPTWGSHATSFTDLGGFSTPVSGLSRTIQVNYTAPSTAGTYYIIAAFQAEYTAAQVMSCTSWAVAAPVWNNGDDVADWSSSTIDTANANGNVLVNYLATSGNLPRYVPATAVKVVVAASGGGGGSGPKLTINQTDTSACPQIRLAVSVTDASGQAISNLGASNFTLVEDGQTRNPTVTAGSSGQYTVSYATSNSSASHLVLLSVYVAGQSDSKTISVAACQSLIANEPALNITLQPGFYITEVTTSAGQGYWGMEVLAQKGDLSGGFNLGGGVQEKGTTPGFGAFYVRDTQQVSIRLTAQVLPGGESSAFSMCARLLDGNKQPIGTDQCGKDLVQFDRTLNQGFYVIEVRSGTASPRATFQLGLGANYFSGGVVVGGFVAQGLTGFGAFFLPTDQGPQEVKIKVLGQPSYGSVGATNLQLRVLDGNRNVIRTAGIGPGIE